MYFIKMVITGGGHSHRLCSYNCDRRRSMVNAAQKGVVYGQSALGKTVNTDNDRSQCGMIELLRKNNSLQFVT